MGRILAIDVGQKRIGMAVTDPLQMIANSLAVLPVHEAIPFLTDYLRKEKVDCFVLGYPKQMNNTPSESMPFVTGFATQLNKLFPDKRIYYVDERFTSKMAAQTLIAGGVKKSDRRNKALIDAISATLILQSFMEMRKNGLF